METRAALAAAARDEKGAGGLLWRAATLGEPQGLVFVLKRPPDAGHARLQREGKMKCQSSAVTGRKSLEGK